MRAVPYQSSAFVVLVRTMCEVRYTREINGNSKFNDKRYGKHSKIRSTKSSDTAAPIRILRKRHEPIQSCAKPAVHTPDDVRLLGVVACICITQEQKPSNRSKLKSISSLASAPVITVYHCSVNRVQAISKSFRNSFGGF